jgi:hypothetical protein
MLPSPLFVEAFTLTRSRAGPASATRSRIDARCVAIRALRHDRPSTLWARALRADEPEDPREQDGGRRAPPGRVRVGEVVAEVAERRGPEARVADRVEEDVGIAVAAQPPRAVEADATEDEGAVGVERVDVVADADAHGSLSGPTPGALGRRFYGRAPATIAPCRLTASS